MADTAIEASELQKDPFTRGFSSQRIINSNNQRIKYVEENANARQRQKGFGRWGEWYSRLIDVLINVDIFVDDFFDPAVVIAAVNCNDEYGGRYGSGNHRSANCGGGSWSGSPNGGGRTVGGSCTE